MYTHITSVVDVCVVLHGMCVWHSSIGRSSDAQGRSVLAQNPTSELYVCPPNKSMVVPKQFMYTHITSVVDVSAGTTPWCTPICKSSWAISSIGWSLDAQGRSVLAQTLQVSYIYIYVCPHNKSMVFPKQFMYAHTSQVW